MRQEDSGGEREVKRKKKKREGRSVYWSRSGELISSS